MKSYSSQRCTVKNKEQWTQAAVREIPIGDKEKKKSLMREVQHWDRTQRGCRNSHLWP